MLRTTTLFRELNDAVQVYFRREGNTEGDFVCECSNASCVDEILLTPAEYAKVRAHPTRFFVVPGHELSELDRIVDQNDRFMVVEKPVVP